MSDGMIPCTKFGIPEEAWSQFHEARLQHDVSVADMHQAFHVYIRSEESRARFIPGFLRRRRRQYRKCAESAEKKRAFLEGVEHKVPAFDISAGEPAAGKQKVATALRLLRSARACYSTALQHTDMGRRTKNTKKIKKLEWTMCHQEVMEGFYCLKDAREADKGLDVLVEIKQALEVHEALGMAAAELDVGSFGQEGSMEFEIVIMQLMGLLEGLDVTLSWQYLKHLRFPEM